MKVEEKVEKINEQIRKENEAIAKLYSQIWKHQEAIARLESERESMLSVLTDSEIDNWLNEKFGISSQKAARLKSIFIVFDKKANFVRAVVTGLGAEFRYVSSGEDEDTLDHWLKENKLYAQSASSFCGRNRAWYDLSLKTQLESLEWEFDENGQLTNTAW